MKFKRKRNRKQNLVCSFSDFSAEYKLDVEERKAAPTERRTENIKNKKNPEDEITPKALIKYIKNNIKMA